jgi:hypothetical protein
MVTCPKSGDFKPEDCEFLVTPIQRFIPWLHGEVANEAKSIKADKPKEKATAKKRVTHKN